MKGYIYKYTYPNGKVYIGQTRRSVEERHMEHMSHSKMDGCQICELAIRKYGEPTLETIEEIEVDDTNPTELVNKLNEAEERWVKHYDCTNDSGKGYNVQLGGNVVTPQEFILQEEWYKIFEEEGWGESFKHIKNTLDAIIAKNRNIDKKTGGIIPFHLKSSDLSKEERHIWYGIHFKSMFGDRTSFSSYVKNVPCADYLADNINNAFEEYVEDIRQTIWSKVMKRKDKVIKEFYRKK